jgi:putative transposase
VPRRYPLEFRRKVLDLIETGRPVAEIAAQLGVTAQTIYNWRNQDRVDRGLTPGVTTAESVELERARRRIRELETELAIERRANELLKERADPKARFAVVAQIVSEGLPAEPACGALRVSVSGFYAWRKRKPSARAVRHAMLAEVIRGIHTASRQTYGARRVHAELVLGREITVARSTVELVMRRIGLAGLPGRPRARKVPNQPSATDLVDRQFTRDKPNELWVTDITEHQTREGKLYCAVVLDAFSRRVVGWSLDANATASLVVNALGMAIENRAADGTIIHADHGTQFTSWAFTQRALDSGLVPSMGSIGDCFDNAMMESFWARMQVELLNRRRWHTRLELANAIFEYLEIFHNRQRRHSSLGMLTPVEYEFRHAATARDQAS